jgi:hypothetical protein
MASTMQLGASRSAFTGKLIAFRSTPVAPVSMRTAVVSVEAGRRCDLTGTALHSEGAAGPAGAAIALLRSGRDSCSSTPQLGRAQMLDGGDPVMRHTPMGEGCLPAAHHAMQHGTSSRPAGQQAAACSDIVGYWVLGKQPRVLGNHSGSCCSGSRIIVLEVGDSGQCSGH